ncbi:MAG: pyruvate kinase [Candidatus Pacearchaeota archaeon]
MNNQKNTKIIGTISDLNCKPDFIEKLVERGMNVARLNTAHQEVEATKQVVENVRSVSEKIPFLLDTKGPEIRTCEISEPLTIDKDDEVEVLDKISKKTVDKRNKSFRVNYENLSYDIKQGDKILVNDGEIKLEAKETFESKIKAISKTSGQIKNKKSVNVPGRRINLPALSKKDKDYFEFCKKNDIDFIAHSFVRSKEDVFALKEELEQKSEEIKIIAKIEDREGIDNLEEILDNVYGIMIARGDLGVEIRAEEIPETQRYIVKRCVERKKPVIVATQMLHSMVENPYPTRAEVSDVANAVYMGADCVMLSEETSFGIYPEKSVETMSNIVKEIEKYREPIKESSINTMSNRLTGVLARSAVKASVDLDIKAIIMDTLTGRTARYVSAFRAKIPVFAQCYNKKVMRKLALSYGIIPSYKETKDSPDEFISDIAVPLMEKKQFKPEDLVVILAGSFGPNRGPSFIEIGKVEDLVQRKIE